LYNKKFVSWDEITMTIFTGHFRQRVFLKHSLLQFLGLFCVCCFLIISCGRSTSVNSPNSNTDASRVTIGTTLKIRTIDPADAYETLSAQLFYNLGDRLYAYQSGSTKLIPQLATALPKISDDGLTYTIPIRQGVSFHDGTVFNAAAMVFSLDRFIKNSGRPSFLLGDLVDSVKATGDYELTIKLKKPFAAFTSLLTFPNLCAISPKVYEIGDGKFKPDTFVGTGPYQLTKYGSDSLKLDVFDKYWGEKPANPGVNLQLLSSPVNLFNSFRTGAVDVAYLSLDPEQIRNLEKGAKEEKWHAIASQSNTVSYMVLNQKSKPLDQLEVRQAIALMIDRPLMNERVLLGQALPLYSLVPTTFSELYQPVFKDKYGDANFAKAKELLTKAGFSPTNPAKVEIWYPTGSGRRALVAQLLKALAKRHLEGLLQIEIQTVESATLYKDIEKGVYQSVLVDWYADFFDADNYIQPFLECTKASVTGGCEKGASQGQGSFFYSEKANQLIDKERQEINPKKRQEIFAQLQTILADEVPYIPLWQDRDYTFSQKAITGVILEPTQSFLFSPIRKQ
jgi:peptide/nickel transport system substrate-binding protein